MQNIAREVFRAQAQSCLEVAERIGNEFDAAVGLILATTGHIIISGMGKSGIIGKKIAATFASTGTLSHFVHPAEAYHGDLGMITSGDTALLISYSGETEEVVRLIPSLKAFNVPIIAMVGNPSSTLGRHADIILNVAVDREVCPNNLAPTTSTTAALIMGDALAVALITSRQFKPDQFAVFHPGGSLGKRLLTTVDDVMHKSPPTNSPKDNIRDVIVTMNRGGLGLSVVIDNNAVVGLVTDGDLRRALFNNVDIFSLAAENIMTKAPRTIPSGTKFGEAERLMLENEITSLVVVSGDMLRGVVKISAAKSMLEGGS